MSDSKEPQWKKDLISWKINPPSNEVKGKELHHFILHGTQPAGLNQRVKIVRERHAVPQPKKYVDNRLVTGGWYKNNRTPHSGNS